MIKKLHINNYALFKNVEIDFTDGFTVISGDTGAGKSTILDILLTLLTVSYTHLTLPTRAQV